MRATLLIVSVCGMVCSLAPDSSAQDSSTIRVPVRLVAVPTLVMSQNGKLIPDLKVTDFRLTEDDGPREINLDTESLPLSIAVVVQMNQDVRAYLPFVSRVGSILDNSLAASTGETALIAYNDTLVVLKPFDGGDLQGAMRKLSPSGSGAHLADAGLLALELLRARKGPRSRVVLFVGQSIDSGSDRKVAVLQSEAEQQNVQIYALKLPLFGRSFVSDTFRLQGLGSQGSRGGYQASIELTRAIPAARHAGEVAAGTDPHSSLTETTGGFVIHFRKQRELEDAVLLMGDALRSRYFLSFSPHARDSKPHRIKVEVKVPGARVYARSEYNLLAQ